MTAERTGPGREIAISGGRHVAILPVTDESGDVGLMLRFRRPSDLRPEQLTMSQAIKDGELVTRFYLSTEAAMALAALLATADFALAGGTEDPGEETP